MYTQQTRAFRECNLKHLIHPIKHCFGLCSAPKLFTAVSDALAWAVKYNGISNVLHYLDNFFCSPAESSLYQKALDILNSIMITTCIQGGTKQNCWPIFSGSLRWYRDQLSETGTLTFTTKANLFQEHQPSLTWEVQCY